MPKIDDEKPNDTERAPPPQVIPAGGARAALVQASARLALAIEDYTRVAEAIARGLDGHGNAEVVVEGRRP